MGDVYFGIDEIPRADARAITVGNFDGFHRGHKAIIDGTLDTARRLDARPMLLTFRPHPRFIINPDSAPQLILTPEEELETLQQVFPGDILLMTFDDTVRNMSEREFIQSILIDRLSLKALISGESNTLGKNRVGDRSRLEELSRQLGYEFVVIKPVTIKGKALSSTLIRAHIASGELGMANQLLEMPYRITGEVIRGMGLGRKLGYPTANLEYNQFKALPGEGIYAATVIVDEVSYGGMMFVGKNHLNPQEAFSVEAHILDFDREIYGEIITFLPFEFVRENRPIKTTEELVEQIGKDKIVIESILKKKETSSVC